MYTGKTRNTDTLCEALDFVDSFLRQLHCDRKELPLDSSLNLLSVDEARRAIAECEQRLQLTQSRMRTAAALGALLRQGREQ